MSTCLVSFLAERINKMRPGIKGYWRGTGAKKEGCFAHVVHVWHMKHVETNVSLTPKECARYQVCV